MPISLNFEVEFLPIVALTLVTSGAFAAFFTLTWSWRWRLLTSLTQGSVKAVAWHNNVHFGVAVFIIVTCDRYRFASEVDALYLHLFPCSHVEVPIKL